MFKWNIFSKVKFSAINKSIFFQGMWNNPIVRKSLIFWQNIFSTKSVSQSNPYWFLHCINFSYIVEFFTFTKIPYDYQQKLLLPF